MPVTSWSTTAADNDAAPPAGAPEDMNPGDVNNVLRQVMADSVVEFQRNAVKYLGSVAGTNTITASMTPALTAYSAGMMVVFTPANSNTGATTLNINSLGALDVQKQGAAIVAGDLVAGRPAVLVLDSGADDWTLLNPQYDRVLSGTLTQNFGGVPIGGAASTTITVTGAVTGDPVAVGINGIQAGLQPFAYVSATDTVTIGFFNHSSGIVDPAQFTFNVRVIR